VSSLRAASPFPTADYYLQQDEHMQKIREQYVEHVTKMFTLLGDTPEQAATEAKAGHGHRNCARQGVNPARRAAYPANVYHVKTIAEVQTLTPGYKVGRLLLCPAS